MQSSTTLVSDVRVSPGIDPLAVVSPQAKFGFGIYIESHAVIGADVVLGCRVKIHSGAKLTTRVCVGDDVSIGANAVFADPGETCNDERAITVGEQVTIGAGAVILSGVTIGRTAVIRPGAVVTKSVPAHAIVEGNPAFISGYRNTPSRLTTPLTGEDRTATAPKTKVSGVTLHRFPLVKDLRGDLSFGEFTKVIPFEAKRYFLVFNVPSEEIRGEHAHRQCEQFLICVNGACSVVVDDCINREEFRLDNPTVGLYLPPMVWGIQYKYSADGLLLVFASHFYEPGDYIRDYDEFVKEKTYDNLVSRES